MPAQRATAFAEVDAHRAGNADRVDARMQVETLVLGRHDRVAQMPRHALGCHRPAELITAPRKDIAVPIQQRDRATRAPIQQLRHIRQRRIDITRRQSDDQPRHQTDAPTDPPDDPPHPPQQSSDRATNRPTATRGSGPRRSTARLGLWFGLGFGFRFAPVGHQRWLSASCICHVSPVQPCPEPLFCAMILNCAANVEPWQTPDTHFPAA